MTIYIGSDHRGVELKNIIKKALTEDGFNVIDTKLKNYETDDYPDFAFEVGNNVRLSNDNLGILICGNGIGISIAANKVKGIRCARVITEDDAFKAKNHNGANIIAIGAEMEEAEALKIINVFISTKTASEERHLKRINKIIKYESGE
jgi:ribose 5-phosphate isomerase B